MIDQKNIGEKVADLIKARQSSQAAEAERMNIAPSLLSDLCNGKRDIRANTLRKLCLNFRVSADWLLGLSLAKTTDANVQAVAAYTGLSDDVIAFLHNEKEAGRLESQTFIEYLLAYKQKEE